MNSRLGREEEGTWSTEREREEEREERRREKRGEERREKRREKRERNMRQFPASLSLFFSSSFCRREISLP